MFPAYHRRVTNEATNTESETGTDHSVPGHSCDHCASAEDHHALDEKGIVDAYRGALSAAGIVRIVLALALVVSSVMWAPLGIVAGLAAWAVATGAGILVMSAASRRAGTARAVILGTVASAALLPVGAWATTMWLGGSLAVALAAASGWFAALAVVEFLRDRKLGAVLIADSRDGEAARQGVLFGSPVSPWLGLAWSAFTAALFGAWVGLIGLVPLAVLPLIPLQVVLALLSRKGSR